MKKIFRVLGIIAIIAVIGFSFTACGDDSGGDGNRNLTWKYVSYNPLVYDIYAIAYGNGKFVAGSILGQMAWSTDGTIWTASKEYNSYNIYAIAYGNGTFVAGGEHGKMAYSTGN